MDNTQIWNNQSLYNYPRPQGNLPMFKYGLKKDAQVNFVILYKNVGKYTSISS